MEDGKVLLCRIFNINPIVSAAVFALVMDIVAVDRPVTGLPMSAAQAAEIGVLIIRCHHTCAVALGAFYLNAGGQGVVCTVCKVGFINDSAHAPTLLSGNCSHSRNRNGFKSFVLIVRSETLFCRTFTCSKYSAGAWICSR
jgi:hypothetical protein